MTTNSARPLPEGTGALHQGGRGLNGLARLLDGWYSDKRRDSRPNARHGLPLRCERRRRHGCCHGGILAGNGRSRNCHRPGLEHRCRAGYGRCAPGPLVLLHCCATRFSERPAQTGRRRTSGIRRGYGDRLRGESRHSLSRLAALVGADELCAPDKRPLFCGRSCRQVQRRGPPRAAHGDRRRWRGRGRADPGPRSVRRSARPHSRCVRRPPGRAQLSRRSRSEATRHVRRSRRVLP